MAATVTQTIKDAAGKTIAVFYDDGTIRFDHVVISYPHLGKPYAKASKDNPNPKPVYSASFLLEKKRFMPVKNALVEHNKLLMAELKIDFVKDENKYIADGDKTGKPENVGMFLVRAREERKPFVKDERNGNMTDENAERDIQGGDIVSGMVRPWAQKSNDYGKRLNCGLTGVKKLSTGERFGQGRIGDEEVGDRFSDVAPDEAQGGFSDDEEL